MPRTNLCFKILSSRGMCLVRGDENQTYIKQRRVILSIGREVLFYRGWQREDPGDEVAFE